MLPYAVRQLLWMLKSALQLMYAMSNGVIWVLQMLRLFFYGGCIGICFVPHWWWYLTSSNIIRRVSYRSSETTKRRNILRVLEAEGVDMKELLMRERGGAGERRPPPRRRPPPPEGEQRPQTPHVAALDGRRPLLRRGPPRSRSALHDAPASEGGAASALARLLDAPSLNVNPADGSAMRSLPKVSRQSTPLAPIGGPRRRHGSQAASPESSVHVTTPLAVSGHNEGNAAARSSPFHPSASTAAYRRAMKVAVASHRPVAPAASTVESTRAMVGEGERAGKQSSSSSCDVTCKQDSSGEEAAKVEQGKVHYYDQLPQLDSGSTTAAQQQEVREVLEALGEVQEKPVHRDGSPTPLRPRRRRLPPSRSPLPAMPLPPAEEHYLSPVDPDEEDEEDRMNLHNRATVDIVLPVPLDMLMKTMDYAKRSKTLRRKRFPIVIVVSGGVWIIGSHLWGSMISRVLAQRGYLVFCPDYRNFPQTTMEGMTLDVSDAIAWVLNNAERYNGDLDNVTILGHSAGAHLTMMSLLSQAQTSAYQENKATGAYDEVPPPSDVAYNVLRYNPRESIHRFIGLSGFYNIEGLVQHFSREGLNTPVLHQIVGGPERLPRYTMHAYFDIHRCGETGEVLPDNIFDFYPRRMIYVHGDADKCAPVVESSSMVGVLRSAQLACTLRRLTRAKELRRHAERSRRLIARDLGEEVSTDKKMLPEEDDEEDHSDGASSSLVHAAARAAAEGHSDAASSLAFLRSPSLSTQAAMDPPKPAVDVEFILIPGAHHSDAFIDECIAAQRSCCVDYISDYEATANTSEEGKPSFLGFSFSSVWGGSAGGNAGSTTSSTHHDNSLGHGLSSPTSPSSAQWAELTSLGLKKWNYVAERWCVLPDGVLPMAVPPEDRSLLLRFCQLICPF